jgi:hypothetical protein
MSLLMSLASLSLKCLVGESAAFPDLGVLDLLVMVSTFRTV